MSSSTTTRVVVAALTAISLSAAVLVAPARAQNATANESQPQSPRPQGALEPGQAEATATPRSATLPAAWSHKDPEVRGVWLARNDMSGPPEKLVEKIQALKDANFNTVMIDGWFRGYTSYPGSAVVPQFDEFKGADPFGLSVAETQKRGMKAEAWFSYGFYAYYTPDATKDTSMGAILDKHPELVAIDSKGNKYLHNPTLGDFYTLCPSNPKSHEILGQLMVEMVTKYPVDAMHLDRIRYPEAHFCYCPYCKEHFPKETGVAELKEFADGSEEAKKFTEWKRQQTVEAVTHFRKVLHAARPGLKITGYVVGPAEMDSRGQAWDRWIKEGLVDALAVSMYGADIGPAAKAALARLDGDPSKMMCALSAGHESAIYLTNIEEARKVGGLGQCTWYLGDVLDDLEGLKSGPYAKPAASPVYGR